MTASDMSITDHLPIIHRAYAVPATKSETASRPVLGKKGGTKKPMLPSGWTLFFDTETFTDAGQALRFGTYQVRDNGELWQSGIFYDAQCVTDDELSTLEFHADKKGLKLITHAEFIADIFYGIGYELRATIIGFNVPFDISRIAIGHDSARGRMKGGFTFRFSTDKRLPRVQVKHIARQKAFIQFTAPMRQLARRSDRKHGHKPQIMRGHFVDLATLAGALFARSFSLASLSAFLQVSHPKFAFDDFDGPITVDMITYAARDVQTTWECYQALIQRFETLGISTVSPEKVYSEASLGKAYLKEMGIQPWRQVQTDCPPHMIANIMSAYYGGRSEVRIRRKMRQVMLCDFLSMYPTVCTLMGLWRFVIADGMTWRDSTEETIDFLAAVDTAGLQAQAIWRNLATLVRVKPAGDIFPVRARYEEADQSTIGLNQLTTDAPVWFTLADCIASKLLNGFSPEIIKAVTFSPKDIQAGLKSVNISGNADYRVDPAQDDFYKKLIELRAATKRKMKTVSGSDVSALDIEQNALKIAANATSYGVFVQVDVVDKIDLTTVDVYSSGAEPYPVQTHKVEEPGTFFHPLLATLITGAARLMLAITEHMVTAEGLDWSFCDTDSMAIAKPESMLADLFEQKVKGIVNWFTGLNPYAILGSILKIEVQNYSAADGNALIPLYCWAVSAKRYALFNLGTDGRPVIRKASAHGLGHLMAPYDESHPAHSIPKFVVNLSGIGLKLWQHDLWWQVVNSALNGHPNQVDFSYHPALNAPAMSRYAATSSELLRWFKS